MSLRSLILSGLIALSLAACSEEAPTVGEAKAFATVCKICNSFNCSEVCRKRRARSIEMPNCFPMVDNISRRPALG